MARSTRGGPAPPAPKSDAYVGLLVIALLAQIAGAVFFYLDWSSYPEKMPNPPAAVSVKATLPGDEKGPPDGGGGAPKDGGGGGGEVPPPAAP